MIFNHLEINYDSWWHHAKESITKVMLSFLTHPRWRSMRRHTLPTDIANSSYFYDLCKPKLIK